MTRDKNALASLTLAVAVVVIATGCASKKKTVDTTPVAAPAPAPAPAAPAAPAAPVNDAYVVAPGDCLWCISAKSDIYGDPYQWPVIYRANRTQIKDADLIYPGQELTIERGVSAALRDAAVKHARTRGAWSLGVTEDSDVAFLAANP